MNVRTKEQRNNKEGKRTNMEIRKKKVIQSYTTTVIYLYRQQKNGEQFITLH